ncbi:MAG: heat-shock protein Hsp20 [Betaproteobacteria bacterium RIFCSPLOWO2_02_64_14]|nr:MAG: heat-shock protein Hsp20 [Betaproteobacteria bacterium RIFCSPLOWO2_02_64_14]
MTALKRYDPFGDLDDMFKGFWMRPVRFDVDMPQQLQIKLDVKSSDGAYTVAAELPGVKKEDIKIDIDGNRVTISAEVKKESEEKKGEEVIRSERYYGAISRTFTLDADVDEAKADAKYADGVLKLTLPKKAAASRKRVTVN